MIEVTEPLGFASSMRELLRRSTEDLHCSLDGRISELALTQLEDYRDFLLRTAQALVPIEALLVTSGVGQVFNDWNVRSRSEALLSDLANLNEACSPPQLARKNLSISELFGALYVLEGSRLGGQVLLRRVQGSDDERVRSNTRYLRSNDPSQWRSFLVTLESAKAIDSAGVVRGARFAFDMFTSAFASGPVTHH